MSRAEAARPRAWSARRCATRWSVTTLKGWPGCTTGRRGGRAAADAGGGGRAGRGDPPRAGPGGGRLLSLDPPDLCRWLEGAPARAITPRACRGCSGGWNFRARRRGPSTRSGTRRRRRPSKRGACCTLSRGAARHPDKRIELWFEDEARVGNKGRVCHRWWRRGERPPGVRQLGYQWAYIFAAIRPATARTSRSSCRRSTRRPCRSSSTTSRRPARPAFTSSWCSTGRAGTSAAT